MKQIWNESIIEKKTEHTITDYDDMLSVLKEAKKNGYALDDEENEEGVRCIAASLRDYHNEVKYDKLLKIKTTGRDDSRSDQYCYPYEPTPYGVLERQAYCGYLGKKNHLIDYGCGKGRVDFFLAWQVRCRTTGVEYDERMIKAAEENR